MCANDTAFVAHSHQDAQQFATRFVIYAKACRLMITVKKTEGTYQPESESTELGEPINIKGENLVRVSDFK